MDFSLYSAIIGGLCVLGGNFLIGLFNRHIKNKDIRFSLFSKKLDLAIELIDSCRNVAENQENALQYLASQRKIELLFNKEVVTISKEFYASNPKDKHQIFARLIIAIRKELEKNL